jgi:hypothetical protein
MLWTVARAAVQSLTIDEADTYLSFVHPPWPAQWTPHANNHVLNTLSMRLAIAIFGASPLTLRVPALLSAAAYIAAAYFLVRLISTRRLLQWSLFTCLVCSPFVMDYLVAARGYGMASAFLLWMLVIAARFQARDPEGRKLELRTTCVLISIAGALSVCANFSFAIAVALTGLGLFLWIGLEHRREYWKTLLCLILPGLAVGFFFAGSVVLAWPKGQLNWGAESLRRTVGSLVSASLFEPNRNLLNPLLHHEFVHFGTFLYPILTAFALWRLVMLLVEHELDRDREVRVPSALALICGIALLAALLCHEVLTFEYNIPLPLDRTAMWVALLFLAMAGALAAVPVQSRLARISGQLLTATLILIACYNIGCLRLTYFNEWRYDADTKNVYSVLAYYNHTYGVTRVSTNWRYVSTLNCYRLMSGRETLDEIPGAPSVVDSYPAGYQAYVIFYSVDEDFVKREGLKVIYHDQFTDAAIGVRPEALVHSALPEAR